MHRWILSRQSFKGSEQETCIQYLYRICLVKRRKIIYNKHNRSSVENMSGSVFSALSLYNGFCILYAFSYITMQVKIKRM